MAPINSTRYSATNVAENPAVSKKEVAFDRTGLGSAIPRQASEKSRWKTIDPLKPVLYSRRPFVVPKRISPALQSFTRMAVESGMEWDSYHDLVLWAFIVQTLEATQGNISKAAKKTGIHRNTISRWMYFLKIPTGSKKFLAFLEKINPPPEDCGQPQNLDERTLKSQPELLPRAGGELDCRPSGNDKYPPSREDAS